MKAIGIKNHNETQKDFDKINMIKEELGEMLDCPN